MGSPSARRYSDPMTKRNVNVSLWLNGYEDEALSLVAKRRGMNKSETIRALIRKSRRSTEERKVTIMAAVKTVKLPSPGGNDQGATPAETWTEEERPLARSLQDSR